MNNYWQKLAGEHGARAAGFMRATGSHAEATHAAAYREAIKAAQLARKGTPSLQG